MINKASPLRRSPTLAAFCLLLAAILTACGGGDSDAATGDRVLDLESKTHSLQESLETLQNENATLQAEIAALQQNQSGKTAETTPNSDQRLDDLDARLRRLEALAAYIESLLPVLDGWDDDSGKDDSGKGDAPSPSADDATVEQTASLVAAGGGEVHYLDHPERGARAVLVAPPETVAGETPLIVSLHGYGGNSAVHAAYLPLHERVNTGGFALLLPNGVEDDSGNRFWNPTDRCCAFGKTGEDDAAYLTELVAQANTLLDFGPVYVFGYSNGGFMAYWLACQGLPGLRAIVSLAGTSYLEDSHCEGAPPVSVLHIHGANDSVIRYDGDRLEAADDGDPAFYAGAQEMVMRWARRAGCPWPETPEPYAAFDFDEYVPGAETQAYQPDSGCADGINIQLWAGQGTGHAPGYGAAFTDALLNWLLAQQ